MISFSQCTARVASLALKIHFTTFLYRFSAHDVVRQTSASRLQLLCARRRCGAGQRPASVARSQQGEGHDAQIDCLRQEDAARLLLSHLEADGNG